MSNSSAIQTTRTTPPKTAYRESPADDPRLLLGSLIEALAHQIVLDFHSRSKGFTTTSALIVTMLAAFSFAFVAWLVALAIHSF